MAVSHLYVRSYLPSLLATLALVGCGPSHGGGGGGGGDDDPGDVDGGQMMDGHVDHDGGTPDGNVTTCAATESCDGVIDDNCDGQVDENCGRCPLLTLSCPTGCCPVDRWEVSNKASYGADIAVAADGTIYFAYTTPSSGAWTSTLAIYDPTPGTWRSVPLGGGTYRNRVRLDHLGRLHVVNASNNGAVVYRRSDDRGVSFTTPYTVGTLDIGGVFDLEVDSLGQPHIVYAQYSSQHEFAYKHLVNTQWVSETPDIQQGNFDNPDIALGFADRPHIVYDGYESGNGLKKYLWHNGNRWILETFDSAAAGLYTGFDYFSSHTLRIAANDARELLFTRMNGGIDTMFMAKRGSGDNDAWQVTPITGPTGFETPVMFVDTAGKLAAVGKGLAVYRESNGTMWSTTALGIPGENAAVARRGKYFYIAYTADNEHPTLAVIELQ
ncbi:MAG: hypothetical protein SFX73_32900 [Kofleriaceae bacterium]|nr:hypothetical protein [Kofleriaceae bacterium]